MVYTAPRREPSLSQEEKASVTSQQHRLAEERLRQNAAAESGKRATGYNPDRTSRVPSTSNHTGNSDQKEILQLIDPEFLAVWKEGDLRPQYEEGGDNESQNLESDEEYSQG